MNLSRASLLMFAALAAGVSGRLGFHRIAGNAESNSRSSSRLTSSGPGVAPVIPPSSSAPGPRPEASAVLSSSGATRLRLLLAWLPGASDDELLRMAGELTKKTAADENLSIRLLMARWAEVNPQALLAWTQSSDGMRGSGFYVANAIEAWARVDFDAAWSAASSGLQKYRSSALLGLTAMNPERCRSLIAADPSLLNASGFSDMGTVLGRIAAKDPQGAAALLSGITPAREPRFAAKIADAWVKSDPAAAVAWMSALPPEVRASPAMTPAARWIAANAPDQLSALLDALPAGAVRSKTVAAELTRLAAEDPAAARRKLEEMPSGPTRQWGRALLMQELLKSGDIPGATEMAKQIGWRVSDAWKPGTSDYPYTYYPEPIDGGNVENPREAMKDLLSRVAATDPKGAAGILSTPGVDTSLGNAAAVSNPAEVASALAAHPEDRTAAASCASIIGAWAVRDPAAAAAWVDAQPAGTATKSDYMSSLFGTWAQSDPAAMLNWAAQREGATKQAWRQIPPEYSLAHLDDLFAANVPDTVQRLLETVPLQDSRRIMKEMPDDMEAPLSRVMNPWLKEDARAASEWVAGLPQGLKRDSVVGALSQWLNQEQDFEAAFKWAVTLPAEKSSFLIRNALSGLRGEDPAKAEALVRSSSLTPEQQQKYLSVPGSIP